MLFGGVYFFVGWIGQIECAIFSQQHQENVENIGKYRLRDNFCYAIMLMLPPRYWQQEGGVHGWKSFYLLSLPLWRM